MGNGMAGNGVLVYTEHGSKAVTAVSFSQNG